MISATFAQVLRSGRDHFNSQFAAARHADPTLDGTRFAAFLSDVLDPVVQAVDAACPERTADFVTHAYAVALELATLRLVGPGARQPVVETAWRRLLSPAAALIASDPRRALSSISNAAHQLASTNGARVDRWLVEMETTAAKTTDLDTWLTVGLVAGWRAGLAQYRASALSLCDRLPPELALAAVGAPDNGTWPDVRARLQTNPWYDPGQKRETSELRVVMRAGAFRGFGGVFAALPQISSFHDHFIVTSGDECWVLTADAFGATFHRATAGEKAGTRPPSNEAAGVRIDGTRLSAGGQKLDLGELGAVTSVAANATTIAVTGQLTYAVILVQRPRT